MYDKGQLDSINHGKNVSKASVLLFLPTRFVSPDIFIIITNITMEQDFRYLEHHKNFCHWVRFFANWVTCNLSTACYTALVSYRYENEQHKLTQL